MLKKLNRRHSDVPMSEAQFLNMLKETMAADGLELNLDKIEGGSETSNKTLHIDLEDIEKGGLLGGPNSLFRKPFG